MDNKLTSILGGWADIPVGRIEHTDCGHTFPGTFPGSPVAGKRPNLGPVCTFGIDMNDIIIHVNTLKGTGGFQLESQGPLDFVVQDNDRFINHPSPITSHR